MKSERIFFSYNKLLSETGKQHKSYIFEAAVRLGASSEADYEYPLSHALAFDFGVIVFYNKTESGR